jgi:hypothetical protein
VDLEMPTPISPDKKDYYNSKNKFHQLKTAEAKMNNPQIGGTKRAEAARKVKRLTKKIQARGYCTLCEPLAITVG